MFGRKEGELCLVCKREKKGNHKRNMFLSFIWFAKEGKWKEKIYVFYFYCLIN
jgi:hypothetical protein